jgi:hypothetical protein
MIKPDKDPGAKPEKNQPEVFLGFEIDLDFSRPWFSEIRPKIIGHLEHSRH